MDGHQMGYEAQADWENVVIQTSEFSFYIRLRRIWFPSDFLSWWILKNRKYEWVPSWGKSESNREKVWGKSNSSKSDIKRKFGVLDDNIFSVCLRFMSHLMSILYLSFQIKYASSMIYRPLFIRFFAIRCKIIDF